MVLMSFCKDRRAKVDTSNGGAQHESGWRVKRFDELVEGDIVKTPTGEARVSKVYEKRQFDTTFEIETLDKESGTISLLKVSGDHLFYVVSEVDIENFRARKKASKKALSIVSPKALSTLETMAADKGAEVSIKHLVDILLDGAENPSSEQASSVLSVVLRCAQAVGHTSENEGVAVDDNGDAVGYLTTTRYYPADRLAQQVLVMTGKKKYAKVYTPLKGRVIDAKTIALLMDCGVKMSVPSIVESESTCRK